MHFVIQSKQVQRQHSHDLKDLPQKCEENMLGKIFKVIVPYNYRHGSHLGHVIMKPKTTQVNLKG